MFETWKIKPFSEGRMPSTITRDLATISGVLSRAVKLEKLTANVIRKVDVPPNRAKLDTYRLILRLQTP
jgi:hypothetical protein